MLTIKIKTVKYNQGTVEWLSRCIEKGTVYFEEAITGSGNHGLMLKQIAGEHPRPRSMNVAIFDSMKGRYIPCDICIGESSENDDIRTSQNIFRLTPAAAKIVSTVAVEWCETKNYERDNDELCEIDIIMK